LGLRNVDDQSSCFEAMEGDDSQIDPAGHWWTDTPIGYYVAPTRGGPHQHHAVSEAHKPFASAHAILARVPSACSLARFSRLDSRGATGLAPKS
jgi:hypothetical protein